MILNSYSTCGVGYGKGIDPIHPKNKGGGSTLAKTKNRRVVFLPIKPEFAHKIINGEKNIEFRKKFSSQEVETIVIYSSSPEKRVIGYATVDSIVIDTPDSPGNASIKMGESIRIGFLFILMERKRELVFELRM
ncbi:Uncharacterized protein A9P81_0990 [Leptospira interrogans serovar Copenhageni/Icterohaemorrhagiae]|nr:Uncharacterized protein A9P81_0990 [Leptospira interrogans serovar Copenhageni/Icterohaemorrhagiae]